jgi:hypothetical protein
MDYERDALSPRQKVTLVLRIIAWSGQRKLKPKQMTKATPQPRHKLKKRKKTISF